MYDEIEEDDELLDAMQRFQQTMAECRNEVIHYRLLLAEDAGPHNRRMLAQAKARLSRVEAEYAELLNLN